jgi:predicted 3-demethylubiquinone-9 3-methyltransferase (glyoxalase superfamily)
MPAVPVTSQKITTFLMFEGNAEEAMRFYVSLFDDAEVLSTAATAPARPDPRARCGTRPSPSLARSSCASTAA